MAGELSNIMEKHTNLSLAPVRVISPRLTPAIEPERWLHVVIQYLGSSGSMGFVLVSQLITFVILARHLGNTQFGQLMAITAATQIAMSLCGLGGDEPMICRLVRDPSLYPALLGHNLILIVISGLVLAVIATTIVYFIIPIELPTRDYLTTIAILALSNIILFRVVSLTESIFIGRREYMRANAVVVSFAAARLLTAIGATVVFKVDSLQIWAFWHGAVHIIGAFSCAIVLSKFSGPRWTVLRDELKRGTHIIIPIFLNTLRQNIDPLVLSLAMTAAVVGNYSAASRIVQASLYSVWSFNRIMYPRLVVAGEQGRASTFALASRFVFIAGGLGALTSVGLFVLAPYLADFFGKGFLHASTYIRILCWLAFLAALQSTAYDALGALEKHPLRATILNTSSIIGAALVMALTYLYGVNGIFIALYLSQLLAVGGLWTALVYVARGNEPAMNRGTNL